MSKLIVIEGIDGSGKGTQVTQVMERLRKRGLRVGMLGFPRYTMTFFGHRVGDMLNQKFGSLNEIDPFLASLLYAGDRLESRALLSQMLDEYHIVLLDRYVPSSLAHQAGKLTGDAREKLIEWIEHVEYVINGMPRPDMVVLLDTTPEISKQLIAKKEQRGYTDAAEDMHEADIGYQAKVRSAYLELADTRQWAVVQVTREQKLRTIEEITDDIELLVMSTLPV